MKVAVLGAGAWGTAIATVLAHNGHEVPIWAYEQSVVHDINIRHENTCYLPGITLSNRIKATSDMASVISYAELIFEAVPVAFLRSTLNKVVRCFSQDQIWVITSKGIEQQTLMLPTDIVADVFASKIRVAVMAGPSFARNVAHEQLTGVIIAAQEFAVGHQVKNLLANAYFKPYSSHDIVGTQLGGALKNVVTLGMGMLDGLGFTDNTKALLLTNGLHEMIKLGLKMGAQQDTFYGLAGVGDLVLTSMSKLSRNLAVGQMLAQGKTLQDIVQELGNTSEGINTVRSIYHLMQREQVDLPLCRRIYQILFEGDACKGLLEALIDEHMVR